MSYISDQVQEQLDTNKPEVAQGQTWVLKPDSQFAAEYPGELRIICRYPFAPAQDGRMWVIENTGLLYSIQRLTEATLRSIYQLDQDAPE